MQATNFFANIFGHFFYNEEYLKIACWRRNSRHSPGVNLGVNADASAKGDGVGSMTLAVEVEEDVEGEEGVPNGKHRRRFVGRWLMDSQSNDRFKVAHAMTIDLKTLRNENT